MSIRGTVTSALMGSDPFATFNPATRAWFEATFQAPTRAQELAWPAIALGESVLVLAPTGSGKTLAAFLAAIDHLMFSPAPKKPATRIIYVSPLKALAVDVERNLREPLVGITRQAQRLDRKSTRLNSSHMSISYAVFCLK